jgi:hypothetical protein
MLWCPGRIFCKRVKFSRRFQQLWKECQRADAASSQDQFVQVLENLSYKECRFDHRSEPMSILCMKFRAVVGVLLKLKADYKVHPADAAWAKQGLAAPFQRDRWLQQVVEVWRRL